MQSGGTSSAPARSRPASCAKNRGPYAACNAVPLLEQVRPASIKQNAEIEIEFVSRQNIAYELVREVFGLGPRKLATFEYLLQISILFNKFRPLTLKVSLCQLRLEQHIPEFHINFGPLSRLAEQRHARHEAKFGKAPGLNAQNSANLHSPCHPGIAEDVHQQRVRAQGRIQFAPKPIPYGAGNVGPGCVLSAAAFATVAF